jgi:hypothetical protein
VSKAPYSYPPDEFDAPPDPDSPRGVHRAPRTAWSRWWPFLAVVVIVPLVAWGAVTYLADKGRLPDIPGVADTSTAQDTGAPPTDAAPSSSAAQPSTPPASSPTATSPAANLATPVSVLNGAKIGGLAKKVGDQLVAAGFTKVTTGNATASTPAASTVFYGSASLKATADLVAKTIKVSAVELSATEAPSGITVVLRSDPSA